MLDKTYKINSCRIRFRQVLKFFLAAIGSSALFSCGINPQEDFENRITKAVALSNQSSTIAELPLAQLRSSAIAAPLGFGNSAINEEQLFLWAEAIYPQFFSPPSDTIRSGAYQFRYYKSKDIYLALESSSRVIAIGKPTGEKLVDLGPMQAFSKLVTDHFYQFLKGNRVSTSLTSIEPNDVADATQSLLDIQKLIAATSSAEGQTISQSLIPNVFFNWIEHRYGWFNGDGKSTIDASPYAFRYYPRSDLFLALTRSNVYAIGSPTAHQSVGLGEFSRLSDRVARDNEFQQLPPIAIIDGPNEIYIARLFELSGERSYSRQGRSISNYSWQVLFANESSPRSATLGIYKDGWGLPGEYAAVLSVIDSDGRKSSAAKRMFRAIPYDRECRDGPKRQILSAPSTDVFAVGRNTVIFFDACQAAREIADVSPLYQWALTEKPQGSKAQLSSTSQEQAYLRTDLAGIYTINLRISSASGKQVTFSKSFIVADFDGARYFHEKPGMEPDLRVIPRFNLTNQSFDQGASLHGSVIADLDRDGIPEIIITASHGAQISNNGVATESAKTQIFIFKVNSAGAYQDATLAFLGKPTILPGWAGLPSITDFNQDGWNDLLLPLTQDDGRSPGDGSYYDARPVAFLSDGKGRLNIVEVPIPLPGYWGAAAVGWSAELNRPFVTGFTGAELPLAGYYWDGTKFAKSTALVPQFPLPPDGIGVPIVMAFSSSSESQKATDLAFGANGRTISAFKRLKDGTWVHQGTRQVAFKTLGNVNFKRYTGQIYPGELIEIEGKRAVFGGGINIDQICTLRLATGEHAAIFTFPLIFLANQSMELNQDTLLDAGKDLLNIEYRLWLAVLKNDGLVIEPLSIAKPYRLGDGNLLCADVNKDGHEDLIWRTVKSQVMAGETDLNPIFFIARTDSTFVEVSTTTTLPATINQFRTNTQVFISDFDGDGYIDFLILPGSIGTDLDKMRNESRNLIGTIKIFYGSGF
jgi:hypothetical protein